MAIVRSYEPAPYPILGYIQSMDRSDDNTELTAVSPSVQPVAVSTRRLDSYLPPVPDRSAAGSGVQIAVSPDVQRPLLAANIAYTLPPPSITEPPGFPPPRPLTPIAYLPADAPRHETAQADVPTEVFLTNPPPVALALHFDQPATPAAALAIDPPPTRLDVAMAAAAPAAPSHPLEKWPLLRKTVRFTAYAFAGWLAVVLVLIVVYRFVNPPMSSLMLQQRLTGQDIKQIWARMESISPQIVRAVLLSEDGRFCQHNGIDVAAMLDAIEHAGDGTPRGASTISMQVTKNLFLWPSKSYLRKAIEIPLTLALEIVWPKRRIMEVYLNIAEWGPGIFGVEAASRFHFDKAASRLNEREAAQLAVALPNPYARDPGEPGPGTRRLASDVQARMRGASPSQTACVLGIRKGGWNPPARLLERRNAAK